ncbi:MAG: ribonuclease III [Thermodesulfobacteriota bacterium]
MTRAGDMEIEEFGKSLPFPFEDRELLKKVFVHRSYLNERGGRGLESNERLEFLGDSVLGTVVSDMLFKRFPDLPEGELTHLRAKLVNRRTLAHLAGSLALGELLLLGRGERLSGGGNNTANLAGVFEALLGAVFLERGFDGAYSYIEGLYAPMIEELLVEPGHFGYKPALQKLCQKLYRENPQYRLIGSDGPPHRKTFEVEVYVMGELYGRGSASRKKDAEQEAAGEALKRFYEESAAEAEP